MSVEDPRCVLNEVIHACEQGALPLEAGEWAASAYDTADSILKTIDSMLSDDKYAPTEGQDRALRNISTAATKWLNHRRFPT